MSVFSSGPVTLKLYGTKHSTAEQIHVLVSIAILMYGKWTVHSGLYYIPTFRKPGVEKKILQLVL